MTTRASKEIREAALRIGEKNRKKVAMPDYQPMEGSYSEEQREWRDRASPVEQQVLDGVDRSQLCGECFTVHAGECA